MPARFAIVVGLTPAVGWIFGVAPAAPFADVAPQHHRGVAWVAGRTVDGKALDALVAHGVTWIAQTPFGWQQAADSPEIHLVTQGRVYWGETDEGLRATTRLARERGIRTLLKPHIWLRRSSGKWRGEIAMQDEDDWQRWFESYRRFILHYAHLAQEHDIEAFCVGTELHRTVVERPDDWRALIAEVRQVYDGKLTYGANWYQEFEDIDFWDTLDYIVVQVPTGGSGIRAMRGRVVSGMPTSHRRTSLQPE